MATESNDDSLNLGQEGVVFKSKFEKDEQVVSALHMVGAGFEARGGSSLMLTEAVENGVDAIIDFKKKEDVQGKVKVIIDCPNETVIVVDNGTGFTNVKHVCEKPFDSLKKGDIQQTGQFARGLQGFRTFCDKLTYISRRKRSWIPQDEPSQINSSEGKPESTVMIEFEAHSGSSRVKYVQEASNEYSSEFLNDEHGTLAIYQNWRPGEFEKFNKTQMIKRLEHHFGELIRDGEIQITIEERKGKIQDIGPEQVREHIVEPRDYSPYTKISLEPITYEGEENKGMITFNLYLSDRGKADRWHRPYLLYKKRPVGDGFVADIDEFAEQPIWRHKFLTGYITCDFCQINELRQGLRINAERDFLFKELIKLQKKLERKVKEHAKGLYELRLQSEVNDLVKDLQTFFKKRNIFNFRKAKSTGFISTENPDIEIVELAKKEGDDETIEVPTPDGQGTSFAGTATYQPTNVEPEVDGQASTRNPEVGMHAGGTASSKVGSPGGEAAVDSESTEEGYIPKDDALEKPADQDVPHEAGGDKPSGRKGKRHRPKGFGIAFQADEFNNDLSWFDDVNHIVIINSEHPRFTARQDEKKMNELMKYLAELYIWEITRLIHGKEEESQIGMEFLRYKYEFSEQTASD